MVFRGHIGTQHKARGYPVREGEERKDHTWFFPSPGIFTVPVVMRAENFASYEGKRLVWHVRSAPDKARTLSFFFVLAPEFRVQNGHKFPKKSNAVPKS